MGSAIYVHVALTAACLVMLAFVLLEVRAGRQRPARIDRRQMDELRAAFEKLAAAQANPPAVALQQAMDALRAALDDVESLRRTQEMPAVRAFMPARPIGSAEPDEDRTTYPSASPKPTAPRGLPTLATPLPAFFVEEDDDEVTHVADAAPQRNTPPMNRIVAFSAPRNDAR